jgi:hypothetical protein
VPVRTVKRSKAGRTDAGVGVPVDRNTASRDWPYDALE